VRAGRALALHAVTTISREPEDLPFGRLYSAADLEGHRWMFMQPAQGGLGET
jgi:uncharacterized glyoxalase superfamily protein PhnB